ncbi:MAG: TAXI family TRAP transporter solute-binding subunit [Trueperaceae bacterium]|nr:MAG: TAXI family TRAP transporter solute-binding subunit [Trueperaceae bacterium]
MKVVIKSFVLAVLLCGAALAQTSLSIATGGTGGVYFPTGGAYAELINKYIDGYNAVAEVTGASAENAGLISRGDSDIALALADTIFQAYTGTGRFDGSSGLRQLANLRALGSAYPNAVHLVTLEGSGIETLQDLKGKRVSVGAPGSGTEISAQSILNANGITYDDINEQRLNFNETADALRDGQIDAGFWSVGPPTSSILSLAEARDIKLISLSDEELQNGLSASPVFTAFMIPGNTYKGQETDVQTIGTPNVIVVAAEMDDELAYNLIKTIFDHVDEVIAVHPSANSTTADFSLSATPIPLHPGALRYYQEIGAEIPERLASP